MIFPEVLVGQNSTLANVGTASGSERPPIDRKSQTRSLPAAVPKLRRNITGKARTRILANEQTRMTINALSTMAITFVTAVAALLILAGSSLTEAFVAGAVAVGAAFINLVRRPPDDPSSVK